MAIYNTTFMDNSTSVVQLMTGLGDTLPIDYLIGNLMLVTFFLAFLAYYYKNDFLEILFVDGVMSTILAVLLWSQALIHPTTIIYPTLITVLSISFLTFTR
jgi:hypothetical protein